MFGCGYFFNVIIYDNSGFVSTKNRENILQTFDFQPRQAAAGCREMARLKKI